MTATPRASSAAATSTGPSILYLDGSATTPLHPEVAECMATTCRAGHVNPASQHRPGQVARRLVDDAREFIGRSFGADIDTVRPDQVIFTSGGTEANNLALLGLAGAIPGRIIISAIEHPSIVGPAEELARRGHEVRRIRVSRDGVVDLDHLESLLTSDTRVVSLMAANNESGVIQPVERAAEICLQANVPLHVDAVQVAGKLPVDFRRSGASLMTIAPHKFHGPVGIGALLVRAGCAIQPILWGGSQQQGIRPGTESVALAAGFRMAVELWLPDATQRPRRLAALRDAFESLVVAGWPETVVIGDPGQRVPHISNLAFPGFDRQALLVAFDLAGVACSTGSACVSGSSEPSPVHQAMGLSAAIVTSALRFSFHALQDPSDASTAAQRILLILNDLRRRSRSREFPSPSPQLGRPPL